MSRFRKAPELKKSSEEWSDQLPALRSINSSIEQPTNEARHWSRSCCSLSIPTNCNAMILSWRCWSSASLVSVALSTLGIYAFDKLATVVSRSPTEPSLEAATTTTRTQSAYRWRRRTQHLVYIPEFCQKALSVRANWKPPGGGGRMTKLFRSLCLALCQGTPLRNSGSIGKTPLHRQHFSNVGHP